MNLFGLEPDEFKNVLLSVGVHRGHRPLSPVEVATLLSKMRLSGASPKDCAAAVQLEGPTMISRFLRLLETAPEIQHLVDWGQSGATIGFTSASELARLPVDQQEPVADAIIKNQLTGAEVKHIVQRARRSQRTIAEAVQDIIQLRPTIEKRYVYIGAITSPAIQDYLATQSQEQRDLLLADILGHVLVDVPELSARLGRTRFTVASRQDVTAALSARGQDLEICVNAAMRERAVIP